MLSPNGFGFIENKQPHLEVVTQHILSSHS